MSLNPNATSVELCPKCHSFMPLTSYSLPFGATGDRAYLNPPQSDVSVIESMLSAPTTEISDLATEILRVEALLATLKKHHTYLDKHIQRSDAYVKPSPIRQFPTEILSLIFAAACTSFEPADYKTPLNISLVCSKWRAITLSTPTLWSHVYVGSSLHGRDIFEYYLRQCGKLPISIKIDLPLLSPPECNDPFTYEVLHYHLFMSYLSHTSEQWRVLELYVGCKDFDILTRYSRFPILEALTLGLKGNLDSVALPAALSYHAPVLSSLVLLDSSETIDSGRLVWEDCGLPEGLLNIRTNRGDLSYLLDLESSHCFRDEGSTLVLCGLHPSITSSISLRQITNLVLHPDPAGWTAGLVSIFKQVTIPYLKGLIIISPDPAGAFNIKAATLELEWVRNVLGAVPTFLENSNCFLDSFSFIMNGYRPQPVRIIFADALLEACKAMHYLKSLRVIEPVSGPAILTGEFIEGISAGRALLPRLTSLELVWAEDHVPKENVISMLASRVDDSDGVDAENKARLSSAVLGVRNGGELPRAVLEYMKDLRWDGIRASVW